MVRSEAEEVRRGLGVQAKGAAAPLPLPPRCRKRRVGFADNSVLDGVGAGWPVLNNDRENCDLRGKIPAPLCHVSARLSYVSA